MFKETFKFFIVLSSICFIQLKISKVLVKSTLTEYFQSLCLNSEISFK